MIQALYVMLQQFEEWTWGGRRASSDCFNSARSEPSSIRQWFISCIKSMRIVLQDFLCLTDNNCENRLPSHISLVMRNEWHDLSFFFIKKNKKHYLDLFCGNIRNWSCKDKKTKEGRAEESFPKIKHILAGVTAFDSGCSWETESLTHYTNHSRYSSPCL